MSAHFADSRLPTISLPSLSSMKRTPVQLGPSPCCMSWLIFGSGKPASAATTARLLSRDSVTRLLPVSCSLQESSNCDATDFDDLRERIGTFAATRNLSRKMVAYNLLRSNAITAAVYRNLSDVFDAERTGQKKDQEKGERGPDYYVVRRHRVGSGLIGLVGRMVAVGALSTPEAGKVLGVKPTAVGRILGNDQAA